MNLSGVAVGFCTIIIIGLLHPVVIKSEYHIGTRIWPVFLISGIICITFSLLCKNNSASAILSVLGFSLLWSIHELFQQKKRVEKGWFPKK